MRNAPKVTGGQETPHLHAEVATYAELQKEERAALIRRAFGEGAVTVRHHVGALVRSKGMKWHEEEGATVHDAIAHLAPEAPEREAAFLDMARDREAFDHLVAEIEQTGGSQAQYREMARLLKHMHAIAVGLHEHAVRQKAEMGTVGERFVAERLLEANTIHAEGAAKMSEFPEVARVLEELHGQILALLPQEDQEAHRQPALKVKGMPLLFTEHHAAKEEESAAALPGKVVSLESARKGSMQNPVARMVRKTGNMRMPGAANDNSFNPSAQERELLLPEEGNRA